MILVGQDDRRSPRPGEGPVPELAARLGSVGVAPGAAVVVGVSGGADSTGLLVALAAVGTGPVVVVHVEHHTRGRAGLRDALFATTLARGLGLPGFLLRGASSEEGKRGNLEARCRIERESALARVARAVGATSICLAHTRDDLAETVLLRLARGCGPATLAGMQPRRLDGFCRPLLGVRRADLHRRLDELGIPHVEDASNASDDRLRNRVRRRLLPLADTVLGVDVVERLARLAEDLEQQQRLVGESLASRLPAPGEPLPVLVLRAAGADAGGLLQHWLVRELPGPRANRRQIAAGVQLAGSEKPSGRVDIGAGWALIRRYESMIVGKVRAADLPPEGARLDLPGVVTLTAGARIRAQIETEPPEASAQIAVLDCPATAFLWVRHPKAGDRLRLHGGSRKLSALLIDRRVPRDRRAGLLVVEDGTDILWVEDVGSAADRVWQGRGQALVLRIEGGFAAFPGL